ncbi:tRNA-(ms[2]io[6]A)-hydroxylase [Aestuariirhabdus sp. Z084]|uniref:tRNA-(ms[2]io[6]A)-hydroxylase n=1 Tax=Aestuariirhabdus haliotis TaxID=2918751 RepID=UPI00201B35C6|nr:tRNA-(ms[2]io[6]A)-hydroxylase [Aestuariirhabdus haliotis]MCL6414556.1 tRNA-(ms[2]io[6]A)-hydroxylase [Aestuariirhabdus haliotis]MCL6418462.1 tRNA-(ms[2]io[6]A)-hydroxylase [Aestuariirhabdus haliotis]
MASSDADVLKEINAFLACETPQAWLQRALCEPEILLIDHANCEKKAASTALRMMFRYVEHTDLLNKMSRLAREELRHFEQVLAIMQARGVEYRHLSASGYASRLHQHVRTWEPARLVDQLIIGAFIEARSCERFAALAPLLDEELSAFYLSLLRSEGRHYRGYLELARNSSSEPVEDRIVFFRELERAAIEEEDPDFRFHSGVPISTQAEDLDASGQFVVS